jgi:hypothetical protein
MAGEPFVPVAATAGDSAPLELSKVPADIGMFFPVAASGMLRRNDAKIAFEAQPRLLRESEIRAC